MNGEQQNPEHQLEYLNELRRKYEEALNNAQKTENYTEAEKLKEELEKRLTDLEAQFPKSDPESKQESPEYLINPEDKFEEKALEEFDKYYKLGVDNAEILLNMACFNSDKAKKLRAELMPRAVKIAQGYHSKIKAFSGLAGVDNEHSWRIRNLYDIHRNYIKLLLSLAGLDSERAWNLRTKILGLNIPNEVDKFMTISLTGLDSEQAWGMRKDLFNKYGPGVEIARDLLKSMAGIDTEQAWDMRNALYSSVNELPYLVGGIVGIDTETALTHRLVLQNEINFGSYAGKVKEYENLLAKSLAGVDSKEAWDIRADWGKLEKFDLVAKSIAGLDGVKAWGMRRKMVEDRARMKLDSFDLLSSINGEPTTAIGWRTARKYNKEKED